MCLGVAGEAAMEDIRSSERKRHISDLRKYGIHIFAKFTEIFSANC